ncbi:FtsX-like permease family protein [Luteibacter sahnii]|uniref:FtsX-like permease family protein n=1 Tax=Luteibacter sahnii TaxID=3021977 RepID=UPI002A69ED79|nr:FtsX-like permease family protein [Luteibacter sp. PPL193]MDY1549153.1 ABC transporter permease [Luteibacter sp. PPL193]
MNLPPMIAALRHHKAAVTLIALQVALTCAIVCNAIFLIASHAQRLHVSSGIEDDALVWARSSGLRRGDGADARARADLDALRHLPGVTAVAQVNTLPLMGNDWSADLGVTAGDAQPAVNGAALFLGTPSFLGTLGVRLVEGRDFHADEYVDYSPFDDTPAPPTAIVTRQLAAHLWPGQPALGQRVYIGAGSSQGALVVGVVADVARSAISGGTNDHDVLFLPVRTVAGPYALRVDPTHRDEVLRTLSAALIAQDADRIVTDREAFVDTVHRYFHDDRAMVWLLVTVVGSLLLVTALGILGLSSYWVHQRRRHIGVRRALGATRRSILTYFLAENMLVVGLGLAIGTCVAMWLNHWLGERYEVPRLPLSWLGIGALLLWAIGLVAVFGPARRAAAQPPMWVIRQ